MNVPLISIENLHISYPNSSDVVRGISLTVRRNEKVGIVGESGSGKSQTARAIMGLLSERASVVADKLDFNGINLSAMPLKQRRQLRGKKMSMIMQDPHFSLNPVMQIGAQIDEVFSVHHRMKKKEARSMTLESLRALGIDDPERVYSAYPHEISGGMGQRAMIAMMLAPDPEILVADEPTSALDADVAQDVMALLSKQIDKRGMGLLLISHDLELVSKFCDRIIVMYGGRILEECRADQLHKATHLYTRSLLSCQPHLGSHGTLLPTIVRQQEWRTQ